MPSSIPESDSASRPGALRRLTRQRGAVVGMIILAVLAAMALAAPWLSPRDPIKTAPREALQAPGSRFLLGSDQFGRDVASRALHGARLSLTVGLIAVSIAVGLGTPVGLLSGYYGGRVDGFVMRVVDVLLAFPGILLALAIVSVLSPGLNNVMIAVGLSAVPNYARLVRASTLSAREQLYVEAARALGSRDLSIVTRYILPNVVAPLIVTATLGLGTAILSAAALSFLGLGSQPPQPEWGRMLSEGRDYLREAWWISTVPGLGIMLTVLAMNLLGDGLRDVLDPRLKI
ncbi:MAG: peptide ABC transporter permease [Candidatus Rokuibacteriota bacterium]|nr:MAG: peptide ABC transporter permease [Candidatus Rokubacteria bacterium]